MVCLFFVGHVPLDTNAYFASNALKIIHEANESGASFGPIRLQLKRGFFSSAQRSLLELNSSMLSAD